MTRPTNAERARASLWKGAPDRHVAVVTALLDEKDRECAAFLFCHDCREYREAAEARIAELERRIRLRNEGYYICGGCGGPHQFDTSIPSVVWNAVIRAKGMSEYLCTSCIVREFVLAGTSFTAELYGGALNGNRIELRVGGQVADDASKVSDENNALRVELAEAQAEVERLRADYWDLIMVVAEKYPGETRHQTAKRYLVERETRQDNTACAALRGPEVKP